MHSVNNTYRFIALFMAFLMFTSSVGFSMDMHYCQNELKAISFFGKAKSCHDKVEATPKKKGCMHHQKKNLIKKTCTSQQQMEKNTKSCSMEEKDCCENKTLSFKADLDEQVQPLAFVCNIQLQQFLAVYVTTFIVNAFTVESKIASFTPYKSPILSRDIHALIESYLL